MTNVQWIRIASYSSNQEASLALSVLQGSGIEAKVFNQHALGAMPHLNQLITADLMVPDYFVPDALELLGIHQKAELPSSQHCSPEEQAARYGQARKIFGVAFVALIVLLLLTLYSSQG